MPNNISILVLFFIFLYIYIIIYIIYSYSQPSRSPLAPPIVRYSPKRDRPLLQSTLLDTTLKYDTDIETQPIHLVKMNTI